MVIFLLYVNDLSTIKDNCEIVLFADDTNIFVASKSIEDVYSKANIILKSICEYMECNLLHINIKKCCHMLFSPRKRKLDKSPDTSKFNLSINGKIVKQVNETKFLGA